MKCSRCISPARGGGGRPNKMQSWWGGEATHFNPLRLGHLLSEHRHTMATQRALFFFLLRRRQIDIWSPVRLALAKKVVFFDTTKSK